MYEGTKRERVIAIMNYELTDVFTLLAGAILIIALLIMILIKFIVAVYFPFTDECDRINHKIMFSTHHDEREYWIKEKQKLYVSCIPLVGGFLASRMKNRRKC